jgi:photosystem II stability/assembly factor-like uncharacterized protein
MLVRSIGGLSTSSSANSGTVGSARPLVTLIVEWTIGSPNSFAIFAVETMFHPRNPHILYLGSYKGVFKSTNGGKNWGERSDGLAGQPWTEAIAIDPSSPRTIYAGGHGGVFKSVDGGGHWRRASPFVVPDPA